MTLPEIMQLINGSGFPAAVCFWGMFRLERFLRELSNTNKKLVRAIALMQKHDNNLDDEGEGKTP